MQFLVVVDFMFFVVSIMNIIIQTLWNYLSILNIICI